MNKKVEDYVRSIPDFPKPGILFKDITTALLDADTLKKMIDFLCENFKDEKIDYVIGLESRGFIFGMPVAYNLNAGFIPVRKPNKLPAKTINRIPFPPGKAIFQLTKHLIVNFFHNSLH